MVAAAALLALIAALPDLAPARPAGDAFGGAGVEAVRARIVEFLPASAPDAEVPPSGLEPDVLAEILEGERAGQQVRAVLQGPAGELDVPNYRIGDEVIVTFIPQPGEPEFVAITDRWRLPILAGLAALFAAIVLVVGGWRGFRAVLALALTVAIVLRIVIPLLLQGVSPLPLALGVAAAVTVITIGLTEGLSRRSLAAILGTVAALALTAALSALVTAAAAFTSAAGTDLIYLQTAPGATFDVRGMLLAAFIFGALGVLDDVTVTQAATVEELSQRAGLRGGALLGSALNVGRSHIAATINTLFLAYVGASLPLLVLFTVAQQPPLITLNDEVVAVEVVRTIVGSIGIVAAVPLTTLIATWLVAPATPRATVPGGPAS